MKLKSFLEQTSQRLLEEHRDDFRGVMVVVPTRRAAFFLKRSLGKMSYKTLMGPEIEAIEDFIESSSEIKTADNISLLFELFEAFQSIDPKVEFDRFMMWAPVLLSDFDRIDQYLVDPDYLFEYLSEAKAIERWQTEMPENKSLTRTETINDYFTLFANISQVYHAFRKRLENRGLAYRGMVYRHFAENLGSLKDPAHLFQKIYFVGFNAFTESERKIVQHLIASGRAEILWDTDSYYMDSPEMEAGRDLREYKSQKVFGSQFNWTNNFLTDFEKNIVVYGVANATLQARVAGKIYAEAIQNDSADDITAIVLADENLLLPLMHSLDDSVKDLNVTMGLPLRNSLLFTLVEAVFNLQETAQNGKFHHLAIQRVLTHPFVQFYDNTELRNSNDWPTVVLDTLRSLSDLGKIYLSAAELLAMGKQQPLFSNLFTLWPKNDHKAALRAFHELIDLLRSVYKKLKNAIETEYLYMFYTLLQQLENSLSQRTQPLSHKSLKLFLFDLIRQTRIPMSGEPISRLQVLGLLETRALDFKRVILLSANEGVLPAKRQLNSLIPNDIASEAGLPVSSHQESLSAYYFYRLLQRSEEVHLLYTTATDSLGGGERSRFIQQLEYELPLRNPKATLRHKTVVLEKILSKAVPEQVPKDERILNNIRDYLKTKGLFPTHLNKLVQSPLEFYKLHVLGFQEKKGRMDDLRADQFGAWIHAGLERLDLEYFMLGKSPGNAEVRQILSEEFVRLFEGYSSEHGLNRVYFKVGEQQVLAFLRHQIESRGLRKILATEQQIFSDVSFPLETGELPVRVGGKIDRVEMDSKGTLWIMDYKTGKIDFGSKSKVAEAIHNETLISDPDFTIGNMRQLWIYQYLAYKKMTGKNGWELAGLNLTTEDFALKAGFYSLRQPDEVYENPISLATPENSAEYILRTEELLRKILSELLDPSIPLA